MWFYVACHMLLSHLEKPLSPDFSMRSSPTEAQGRLRGLQVYIAESKTPVMNPLLHGLPLAAGEWPVSLAMVSRRPHQKHSGSIAVTSKVTLCPPSSFWQRAMLCKQLSLQTLQEWVQIFLDSCLLPDRKGRRERNWHWLRLAPCQVLYIGLLTSFL